MRRPLLFFVAVSILATFLAFPGYARAEAVPVPASTIYPGDIIRDYMLTGAPDGDFIRSDTITSRAELIGKVARRTLLAGRPIPQNAVEDPQTIANGGLVQLIYEQPGLTITATGQALQAARIGDSIRVRNVESGLVVSGIVTGAGAIRVDR